MFNGVWLSPQEIADKLGTTVGTVRLWLRHGKLKGYKVGDRKWRIKVTDLQEFIERGSNAEG